MVDNVVLNSGSGGDTIAADEIAGIKVQRVKVQYGVDGSATDVSDSNPLPIDDAGGSLTVDNAALSVTGGGAEASALRVTLANDSTGVLSVDDNGGSLTVDVGTALPAGSNAIGKLAANSGVDIGDVDVTSVVPGTGASNLGKAEDAAHTSGDVGVMALGVRNDTLAALAGTDGDYAPLQVNADGALYTDFPDFLVDTNNSTTSTLTANTDYTGTWTDLSEYAGITVSVFADQNSDANGMKFQFSSDGSNADIDVAGGFDYIANTGRQFQFPCFARYFRVVFQNAGTGQTAFRLQTLLHHHSVALTSIHRADADVAIDRSCELVKSILVAQAGGSGDFSPIQATAGGNLKVSVSEISDGLDIGAGNAGSETARVSISTDDVNLSAIKTSVELIDNAISGTEMQVDVVGSLPAGTNAIGKLAANSGVDIGDVDVTSISAGSNLIGDVGISGARTSGGTTLYRNVDVDETEDQVKGTAGQIYWIHAMNLTAAVLYLQIYNATAASVTVGTTTPDLTFPLATQGDTNGAGFTISIPNGIAMSTAITIACTTTIGGSSGPAANGCIVNLGYA